ncbi:hypothetical protein Tco_0412429 [Tanacetum coccineum]
MAYLCLHFTKDHEGNKINTPYPGKTNTPYSIYGNKIFWKISNVVPTPRNPQYAVSKTFDTPNSCIKVNGNNAYELKGKFLDDLHNNDFSGTNGEDSIEHIEYLLRIVDPTDLPNVNQDKLTVLVFPISLVGNAWKGFDEIKGSINTLWNYWKMGSDDTDLTNEKGSDLKDECSSDVDETAKIFKIKDNLLDYKIPLYKTFNEFNYLLKIDTDLFTFEIQEIKTYKEYELDNNMTGELEEPWSENLIPYQLCDHICEPYHFENEIAKWPTCSSDINGFCNGGELPGMLKEEALTHKARIEESWGDANPRVMKFCEWLKNSFKNFYELDYNVLVKLEEYWWKVNAHEKAPFAQWENYGQGPYANAKTKKDYDPNLDNNSNNASDTRDTKKERHDPSVFNIRRFDMVMYSFKDNEKYVGIKENEYNNLTNTSKDTCRAPRNLLHDGRRMDGKKKRMKEGRRPRCKEIDKVGEVSIIWNPMCD